MTLVKKQILKVLVGSRAHLLNDENSDYDYRAVYIIPTEDILSLGYHYKANDWIEGEEDNVSYELGHFLHLATKCNPSILEVFKAPIIEATEDGLALRNLFSACWNPNDTFNAFVGYGLNQRKKFLDRKDNRQNKYAVAYIRTLFNLFELLTTDKFSVAIEEPNAQELLRRYKKGQYTFGEIIDLSEDIIKDCKKALKCSKHVANIEAVNQFLLAMRYKYFKGDSNV